MRKRLLKILKYLIGQSKQQQKDRSEKATQIISAT